MSVTVDQLLRDPFANKTREQKIAIIFAGKPRPALDNLTSVEADATTNVGNYSSKFVIVFDEASYDHIDWLTGCEIRQALFCWPCLLFRSAHEDSWNKVGFQDLINLGEKIKQHESGLLHIQSVLDLQLFFSTIKIDAPSPPLENKEIEKNREIVKRAIDVICFLVTQQKHPRVGTRDKNVLEVEDFLENFHFLRDYDSLQTSLIDDGTEKVQKTPKIITDLIEAINGTMRKAIEEEMQHSNYVSVILSEHSQERTKSQISMVLRYLRNGEVCERFVGFTNVEGGVKTPKMISQLISKVINGFQIQRKAIAYSLDGSLLTNISSLYELKHELKYLLPHLLLIPCYFHDLDTVLLRSLSFSSECDFFVKNITMLRSYFGEDDFENKMDECVKKPLSSSNFAAYLNAIKTHRMSIIDKFDKALADEENLTDVDVIKLSGLRGFLADFKNVFQLQTLLKFFDSVTPLVEAFKSPIPGMVFDTDLIHCVFKTFEKELTHSVVESFWFKCVREFSDDSNFEGKKNSCCKHFIDVQQCIKYQIKYRFEEAFDMGFCQILDLEKSAKSLNSDQVNFLTSQYGSTFDYAQLSKEINLIVRNKSAVNAESTHGLYKFFVTSGLGSSFMNLSKLCEIVLTVPATLPNVAGTSDRTKLDEINAWSDVPGKQYSRDISLLCVEQEYLQELKRKTSFHDDVISEFKKNSKTLELT